MRKKSIQSAFLLLLTATIWGSAFVAQSAGMEFVGPFAFNGIRSLIGSLVLLPVIAVFGKKNVGTRKDLIVGGIACGVVLFIASNLQQIGIQYTSVGKAGFITAFYIVLVPVLGIFVKRKPSPLVWLGVLLALGGLWLLCMRPGEGGINKGDIFLFLGAVMFAVHILVVDRFSPLADGVKLSCIQFFVCGVLSVICMFFTENVTVSAIWDAKISILYAGVLSCGVAYTLQIVSQKNLDPTAASLIMSLESVMSVLAGWVILHQMLSGRELLGCVLVFAAVIFVQLLPEKKSDAPSA